MRHSVCLMDFAKVTDPIKCVEKMSATVVEFANFKYYIRENNLSSLVQLMAEIRLRQICVILVLDKSTKEYASIISPDLVICKAEEVNKEEFEYYLSTQTPITLLVEKNNIEESMKLHEKYRVNLLVNTEIPIAFLEKYDIDKEKIFYKDLPLCTADDYQVHSSLTVLNTLSEFAEKDYIVKLNIPQELSLYHKCNECKGCKQACFGVRKNTEVPITPINITNKLRYHSLMEDVICRHYPKVFKDAIEPDKYDTTWLYPLAMSFLADRVKEDFKGEDYCHVSRLTETMFFCRRDDLGLPVFENKNGKLFWNCLYLNRKESDQAWKSNYDIFLPKDSISILIKLNTIDYSMPEINELKKIPERVIQELLSYKNVIVTEENGSIFINGKKVLGREWLFINKGYIENICIYSSLKDEEENFNMMRNKGDFNSRAGITDLVPEISAEILHQKMFEAYGDFFKKHNNKLNNFGIKQQQEIKNLIDNSKLLNLKGNIIEVGAGNLRLFENSRTMDCDSKVNPDIVSYFCTPFIKNLPEKEMTFVMCRMWNPECFSKPENIKIVEEIFNKNYRIIIYFAHIEFNTNLYSIWFKTDEDIIEEMKYYGMFDRYEIEDLSNGFYELRRKNV